MSVLVTAVFIAYEAALAVAAIFAVAGALDAWAWRRRHQARNGRHT